VVVFAQPEVKVASRIESLNGLAQIAFEAAKELIHLRQLFARVGEEVFDIELGMGLPHVHSQGSAVLAP
jgi:hypothetical protein